jgi:Aspartate/tyrosine/aromatic aminotransferase
LTNPNDPLGVIYKPKVMQNAVEWARARNIHTIVDEIYALSVHKPPQLGGQFQSIIRVLENHLDNNVHFLWGLSKDFGATGFRFAILYTQNMPLLRSLANLNIFAGVPNPMQMIVADILLDDMFVDAFLEQSRSQLLSSYFICTHKLEEMVIPYIPAEAGLFVYVDFSSLIPEQTFEGEMKFASLIQKVARIVMTPGHSQKDCKPGMFRLCYAWVSPQVLTIAMERLSYIILQIRRNRSWDDLVAGNWKNEVTKCGTHLSRRRSKLY